MQPLLEKLSQNRPLNIWYVHGRECVQQKLWAGIEGCYYHLQTHGSQL